MSTIVSAAEIRRGGSFVSPFAQNWPRYRASDDAQWDDRCWLDCGRLKWCLP